jgi:hypothetical protein
MYIAINIINLFKKKKETSNKENIFGIIKFQL